MKPIFYLLFIAILMTGCKNETAPEAEGEAEISIDEIFQKNSETVLANLAGWQNENVDYSMYADNFIMGETSFNSEKDSLNLDEVKAHDKMMWEKFDSKMLNEPQLLPGVNADTKLADGSVRHYSEWEVILPATDSTESKSAKIKLYESFDFNEEGKITFQQIYGDLTALMMYFEQ